MSSVLCFIFLLVFVIYFSTSKSSGFRLLQWFLSARFLFLKLFLIFFACVLCLPIEMT